LAPWLRPIQNDSDLSQGPVVCSAAQSLMDKWPRSYSQLCGEQVGVTVALTSADAARHRNGVIE